MATSIGGLLQIYREQEAELAREIHNAPDRVSAILAVAFLEEHMTAALRSALRDDENALNKMLKPAGPVGSFAAKSNLAYLLDLVDKDCLRDLETLGIVRNAFAHWTKLITFETAEIKRHCESLTSRARCWGAAIEERPKPFSRAIAKSEFVECVSIISTHS